MLRGDGQKSPLSGHTRRCVWTEEEEVGVDVEGAPGTEVTQSW